MFASLEAAERRGRALQTRATALVRSLGQTCVPLLMRKLQSSSERQVAWAFHLCAMLGGPRIVREIQALVSAPAGDLSDERKALLLALLVDLDAPLPDVRFSDADRLAESSVRELMASLETPGDVKQAADLIVAHVPGADLPSFLAELVSEAGGDAMRLLDALVEHPSLKCDTLERIQALRVVAAPERRREQARTPGHCRVLTRPKRSRRPPRPRPEPPHPDSA